MRALGLQTNEHLPAMPLSTYFKSQTWWLVNSRCAMKHQTNIIAISFLSIFQVVYMQAIVYFIVYAIVV